MSTAKAKDYIAQQTSTSTKDWKRIVKKGSGRFCYRQFENKNTNEIILVECNNDTGYYTMYKETEIPKGFYIVLPPKVSKNNLDTSLVLTNSEPDRIFGDPDGLKILFYHNPYEDFQEINYSDMIESWFGVKDFSKYFYETEPNSYLLIGKLSIKGIEKKLEVRGLTCYGIDDFDERW